MQIITWYIGGRVNNTESMPACRVTVIFEHQYELIDFPKIMQFLETHNKDEFDSYVIDKLKVSIRKSEDRDALTIEFNAQKDIRTNVEIFNVITKLFELSCK